MDTALRKKIFDRKSAGAKNLPVQGPITDGTAIVLHPRNKSPEFLARMWKPGQSGNPKGRPKNPSLEEILRKHLGERFAPDDPDDLRTRLEKMAEALFDEGINQRNARIMTAVFDRLWPKPIKIQGDIDNPIAITQITRQIVSAPQDSDS